MVRGGPTSEATTYKVGGSGQDQMPPPEPLEESGTNPTLSFKAALKRGEDVGGPAPHDPRALVRTGSTVPTVIGTDAAVCKGEADMMEMRTEGVGLAACMGSRSVMIRAGPGRTGPMTASTSPRGIGYKDDMTDPTAEGGDAGLPSCRPNLAATRVGAGRSTG
jgi:hypothetical protein